MQDEMIGLRDLGADVFVSMLTNDEIAELDLSQEPEMAKTAGLRFISLPTSDRGVPEREPFIGLISDLDNDLRQGLQIVIHCRIGVGRSALVAAGVLIRADHSTEEAWAAVKRARGVDVPDTRQQKDRLEGILA